jgi:nicotinamidase-related amidase
MTLAPLGRGQAALVLVDVQERLCTAMPAADLARLLKYARALLGAARELGLPVLATEQYPRGLGPTLPALRELLPAAPLEKLHFSCAADPGFAAALRATGRQQVVVAGMEAHVCVFLTARDLVGQGFDVHVCADAVASRTEEHRQRGLSLCAAAGAVVTTAETTLFDLLRQAGTQEFKKLAPLVR